jgi:hypothetical protein
MVGDHYQTYDEGISGKVSYRYLFIESRPSCQFKTNEVSTNVYILKYCHICHESLSVESASFYGDCNHAFHKDCLSKWSTIKKSCPLCFSPKTN